MCPRPERESPLLPGGDRRCLQTIIFDADVDELAKLYIRKKHYANAVNPRSVELSPDVEQPASGQGEGPARRGTVSPLIHVMGSNGTRVLAGAVGSSLA